MFEYVFSSNVCVYFCYVCGFCLGGYNGNVYMQSMVLIVLLEYLSDYEVGIKSEWFDKWLIVNVSVFYYDYCDIQVFVLVLNLFGGLLVLMLLNVGQGCVDGFELELKVQLVNSLYLFVNFGMLNMCYMEFCNVLMVVGNLFVCLLYMMLNVGVDYCVLVLFGMLMVGGDVNYCSCEYFSVMWQMMLQFWQGGYMVLNVYVLYMMLNQKYIVIGYVMNLMNKVYKKFELLLLYGVYLVLYGDLCMVGIMLIVKI